MKLLITSIICTTFSLVISSSTIAAASFDENNNTSSNARRARNLKSKASKKSSKQASSKKSTLYACIDTYPQYEGDLDSIQGKVKVEFDTLLSSLKFSYDLKKADPTCASAACGIHIHSGTTCDDADLVGGHYWKPNTADPWVNDNGAVYVTDKKGNGKGFYGLDDEGLYSAVAENVGHAVVVHDAAGVRYGCGVLSMKKKC